MGRTTTPLTDLEVRRAAVRLKEYVLCDGGGLLVRISPSGSKTWFFNYVHPHLKKRQKLSLGRYPEVGLSKAREKRNTLAEVLADGIDPKAHRLRVSREAEASSRATLKATYVDWLEVWKSGKNEKTIFKAMRQIESYLLPVLGDRPVGDLTAPEVIAVLKPLVKSGKLETLTRVRSKLNQIMTFAVNTGLVDHNPMAGIAAAFPPVVSNNQPALTPSEIGGLLEAIKLASVTPTIRYLMLWSIHTLLRPNECAGARWEEIDWDTKVWTVPAERMKGGRRSHTVPLSPQAIRLLETMQQLSSQREHIFPGDRDPRTHASSQSVNRALIRMGFKGRQTAHGFRSIGSTALNEAGFDPDVIEAALAHIQPNAVRRAYNRTDYLERRRPMMEWWSNFVDQPR